MEDSKIPEGYWGPHLTLIEKNPRNHKPKFTRMTPRASGFRKVYLAESVLQRCEYYSAPIDGDVYYWTGEDELRDLIAFVCSNPMEFADPKTEDALSLDWAELEEDPSTEGE